MAERILFLSNKYPPYIGGSQTQLQLLARQMARSHPVRVAILKNSLEGEGRSTRLLRSAARRLSAPWEVTEFIGGDPQGYADENVAIEKLHLPTTALLACMLRGRSHFERVLERRIDAMAAEADIIHCMKPDFLAFAAMNVARRRNIPIAISPYIHEENVGEEIKTLLRSADVVFSLSDPDRDMLLKLGVASERIRLMGVAPLISMQGDAGRFRSRYQPGEAPVILFLGRLVRYKGAEAMLGAAERVWRKYPDARFVFAGPEGDASPAFDRKTDPRILRLGVITDDDKADAVAAADMLCLPSDYEILPAVFLEAWSYGRPVIGGTAPAARALIEQSGAGLIADHDPDRLADAILTLLEDPVQRRAMGEKGRALIDSTYSREAIAARMLDAYREAIGRRRLRGAA